ncbi:MAG TPA: sodium-dependent transporter [Candidatus Deferrimicrobiaceae bacterium]|nr:sodium-dependent transporter [Candidatus Deferrimicrobiaceae bacterium]
MSSERWSTRAGFIFAAMGSAIGLGSIWKFPYEVGTNGGGGFVLFYLLGLGLIVFPLMLVEFAIGRRGGSHAIASIAAVANASGASRLWATIGMVGVVGAVLILSFYSVIGGWAVAYVVDTIRDGLPGAAAATVQARYDALLAAPLRMTLYHTIFMTATVAVVARGIAGGIERASLYLMPMLIVLVVVLAGYSTSQGDAPAALRFLFALDLDRLSPRVALEALGLGFFSIGVGLAVMVTYAAYAGPEFDLRTVAIVTILSDTAISFLAGLAVFPVVFAERLDPSSGPGLMFVTLPLAFARMPLGAPAAIAFFVLLSLAALASAMSLLEMPVALAHRWRGWSRRRAAIVAGAVCWALGLASVLSFNVWAGWHPLAWLPGLGTLTVFDSLDHVASNVLLPLGGLGLALFGGWVVPPPVLAAELRLGPAVARAMVLLLRYVAPIGIIAASVLPILLQRG